MSQVVAVTIAAKYEDGVFKPLENVEIREGTIVEVCLPSPRRPGAGRRSVREFAFAVCGETGPIWLTVWNMSIG
jgi:predicted DNA-binding antitoxin AbrB/MazE fold protein